MTYATRADLEDRYGADEIAQRESVLPAGSVDRALGDADATIDSYLGGRFPVPLSPVPAVLVQHACALARSVLLGPAADELSRAQFRDTVAWLRDVQKGIARIEGATPHADAAPAKTVEIVTGERLFSREAR